ncbi:hypothetical protein ACFV10_35510 [Streptomyces cyaneofuscatus]|uniref:hypothetical protein n=1 Tax=Streptomyces cyaneofuscatus TaxID=66883 RepID=UPI00367AB3EF
MNRPQKYRKKPFEIEAVRWTEDMSMSELERFTNNLVRLNDVDREFTVYDQLRSTWVEFEYGDWIVKGAQGEFAPCRDEVFRETYEPAKPKVVLLCGTTEMDAAVIGRTVAASSRRARRGGDAV